MQQGASQVYGPYYDKQKNRYRIILVGPSGERVARTFATYEEAAEVAKKLAAKVQARTVEMGVGEYVQWMTERGRKSRTLETTECRLRGLHHSELGRPLDQLTKRKAELLYRKYAETRKPDTHQNALKQARTFGRWCVRRGYLKVNPWEGIEPIGRRSAGKRQLRLDDAKALAEVALSRAQTGDEGAFVVLLALCLGLRASEIVGIEASDIDAGGRVLWVENSKTAAGRRQLEVPFPLHELWSRLPGPRRGRERVFPRSRWWVRSQVHRICAAAHISPVSAHSLRGLHATLAVRSGVSAHAVAAALGHTSARVTRAHYIAPGAEQSHLAGEIVERFLSPAPDAPGGGTQSPGTSDA